MNFKYIDTDTRKGHIICYFTEDGHLGLHIIFGKRKVDQKELMWKCKRNCISPIYSFIHYRVGKGKEDRTHLKSPLGLSLYPNDGMVRRSITRENYVLKSPIYRHCRPHYRGKPSTPSKWKKRETGKRKCSLIRSQSRKLKIFNFFLFVRNHLSQSFWEEEPQWISCLTFSLTCDPILACGEQTKTGLTDGAWGNQGLNLELHRQQRSITY